MLINDPILTTTEAACFLDVSKSTILRWIKKGYFGNVKEQNVKAKKGCGYKIRLSSLIESNL